MLWPMSSSALRDSTHGVPVVDDLAQWVRGHNRDLVVDEVMQELLICHQHDLQKLLDLGVAYPCIG